jgi:geranylgeranyl diphosphate synthase type II
MDKFKDLKTLFEDFIASDLPKIAPRELYEPYNYIVNLEAKRVRPVMLLASKLCFDQLNKDDYYAALAIELFHNFSLMHDDIRDGACLQSIKNMGKIVLYYRETLY